MRLILIAALAAALCGCASNSPQQQVALDVTTRIAIRHALDTPRAIEKARNIRNVAEQVKELVSQDVTVAFLTAELSKEIDELEDLSTIERADAKDLLLLLSALIEQRVGSGELKPEGVVKVTEFADLILGALPVL